MPRCVVPIASPPERLASSARSSAMCQGKITCARSLITRLLADLDPAGRELIDLANKLCGWTTDAACDHRKHAGREDAAGNERELVSLPRRDDRMPGVRAPLIADDNVMLLGQQIDELAFRFVSPLQADNTRAGQLRISLEAACEHPRNRTNAPVYGRKQAPVKRGVDCDGTFDVLRQ